MIKPRLDPLWLFIITAILFFLTCIDSPYRSAGFFVATNLLILRSAYVFFALFKEIEIRYAEFHQEAVDKKMSPYALLVDHYGWSFMVATYGNALCAFIYLGIFLFSLPA